MKFHDILQIATRLSLAFRYFAYFLVKLRCFYAELPAHELISKVTEELEPSPCSYEAFHSSIRDELVLNFSSSLKISK